MNAAPRQAEKVAPGFLHALLGARHFCRVPADKMVHGLPRSQFGHRGQNAECIIGQKDNIVRMPPVQGIFALAIYSTGYDARVLTVMLVSAKSTVRVTSSYTTFSRMVP